MSFQPFPIMAPRLPAWRRSGLLFHWDAKFLTLEALTEQDPTFTRAGTQGNADDAAGNSYTAVYGQPAWHFNATEGYPTLLMRDSEGDALYWALNLLPRAMTIYLAFVEQGTAGASGAKLFHLGHQTTEATDPRFYVDSDGTYYQVVHDNGTTVPVATLAAAPSPGDPVEIRAVLNADGSVLIGQSIDGAAETTDSDATTATLQTAWAGPYLHLNGIGSANQGDNDFRRVKILPGVRTMDECRKAF